MLPRILFSVLCFSFVGSQLGAQEGKLPPVTQLENVTPSENVFESSHWNKPLVLKSHAQCQKYFSAENLAKLLKQVDFDRQVVLVLAWKGSGQDRLKANVLESSPEQVRFSYFPGKTKDLRPHSYVFAVRSDVSWSGKEPPAGNSDEFVKVTVKGKLKTGVIAIGGETTGTAIVADGIRWELDFGKNADLLAQAQKLSGTRVLVKGRLQRKKGVEIGERWIVAVRSLVAAK